MEHFLFYDAILGKVKWSLATIPVMGKLLYIISLIHLLTVLFSEHIKQHCGQQAIFSYIRQQCSSMEAQ